MDSVQQVRVEQAGNRMNRRQVKKGVDVKEKTIESFL